MKFLKISFIFLTFVFFSGCLQTTSLLGPGVTVASTGNIFQAGFQYGANSAIKNETGKGALEHLQDAVDSQKKENEFKVKFKDLVEKKFELTRDKLKLN